MPGAISDTVSAATWFGLATGYLTLTGSYHILRKFLSCCHQDQDTPRSAPGDGAGNAGLPWDSEL